MVGPDPEAAVRAHLSAFSAGDLDRTLEALAPGAQFMSGATLVDPAEFSEFFGWAIRELSPEVRIDDLLVDGDRVACQFEESITRNGARQHLHRAAFYRITDGLITSVKVYDGRA